MMRRIANPRRTKRRLTAAELAEDRREAEMYVEEEALRSLLQAALRTSSQTIAETASHALAVGVADYRARFVVPSRRRTKRRK